MHLRACLAAFGMSVSILLSNAVCVLAEASREGGALGENAVSTAVVSLPTDEQGQEQADKPDDESRDEAAPDVRKAPTPKEALLAELIGQGYRLAPAQFVRHVAPPYPAARTEYYHVGHPGQADTIPRGPDGMTFHWEDRQLRNYGMAFGSGYSLTSVLGIALNLKSQQIDGPDDLLQKRLAGDWIVRPASPREPMLRQHELILRKDFGAHVKFEFRKVEREVYVASGVYQFRPLPGEPEDVQIFGAALVPDSGAGGGSGDFAEFLDWLGRWIETPVVDELTARPEGRLSWWLHARSPFTEQMQKEDHDAEMVLKNVAEQTGLQFTKEHREVEFLFVDSEH